MTLRKSSMDKRKRKTNEIYGITLFDTFEYAKNFYKLKYRIIHKSKYINVEDLGDLETI